MNREFVFDHGGSQPGPWARASSTLNRWMWGVLCCGLPGMPCYFCSCCERLEDSTDHEGTRVNQSTATVERLGRPHRPHAPRGRKSTPEMLSAVRCALTQLQGEPAPPLPPEKSANHALTPTPEPG